MSKTGSLRVCKANPRYFTDASGRAVCLAGSHNWYSLKDMGHGKPPGAFDFDRYVRRMEALGHNFMRMWAWDLSRFTTPALYGGGELYARPFPWKRAGPGRALDGGRKFDLAAFDQRYFSRLRRRVIAAGKRGIYVSVMLFEGWAPQMSQPPWCWDGHPFNVRNNVNGVDGNPRGLKRGLATYTLAAPEVTRVQEAYVRKVIETVNDLDNVLYEICNEAGPYSTAWQYHMIRFVKRIERRMPSRHPVGMTFQCKGGTNKALFESPADWISPGTKSSYRDDPPAAAGRKVILSDTDHLWGLGGSAHWVWLTFLRGMNPIFMDDLDDANSAFPHTSRDKESIRKAMGHVLHYARTVDLVNMAPSKRLASSRFCLAKAGREYLVYQPDSGPVVVSLPRRPRTYAVEWFNTRTAKRRVAERLVAGGPTTFTPPWAAPALLYLKACDDASR